MASLDSIWFGRLAAYKSEHGDIRVPYNFKTADGSVTWHMGVQANAYTKPGANCVQSVRAAWMPLAWCGIHCWRTGRKNLANLSYTSPNMEMSGCTTTSRRLMAVHLADGCPCNAKHKVRGKLCPEREGRLDALGMVWDPLLEDWEDKLGKLVAYKSEHGDVRVHQHFKTADGSALGIWVSEQRKYKTRAKLCPERVGRLDALGMVWDPLLEDWEEKFSKLVVYKSEHGDIRVPYNFKTADGCALGTWGEVATQMQSQGQIVSRA